MRGFALAGLTALTVCGLFGRALADEPPATPGLAAKYPADVGIERDPAVIFHDGFESGDLQKWDETGGDVRVVGKDQAHSGDFALLITATLGKNTGGKLHKWFIPGQERMFVRHYIKFAPDCDYIHHLGNLRGRRDQGGRYEGWGGAGTRPRGDRNFYVEVLPSGGRGQFPPPGRWQFYCYWHRMRACPDGKYWGNNFRTDPEVLAPRGKWICVEYMVKCNTPNENDGELALWIDGKKVGHWRPGEPVGTWVWDSFVTSGRWNTDPKPFEGFNWRSVPEMKCGVLTIALYVTENAARQNKVPLEEFNKVNRVYYDDIVVATEYIGPLQPVPARTDSSGAGKSE